MDRHSVDRRSYTCFITVMNYGNIYVPANVLDIKAKEAIAIWEKGVSKERDGSMTDAIRYYRQALKVHEDVEIIYRKKLHEEWILNKKLQELELSSTVAKEEGISEVDGENNGKEGTEELLPCWILEMLPNDVLSKIVSHVVLQSGESWVNLSLTCSKFNNLCFHDSLPYKTFASYIYPKQQYDKQTMMLNDMRNIKILEKTMWNNDCEQMIKERPFVKFHGVYISIVNYLRHGSNAETSSFLDPIQMITYYRYFRFYPNGKCLRLLTTDEPSNVIKHFKMETSPKDSEVCHWSLGVEDKFSHILINRSNEKYSFIEELQIKNQGHKRHHRMRWISSLAIDKEGTESFCSLNNEKTFVFSGVKTYK